MCGRYTIKTDPKTLQQRFAVQKNLFDQEPRFNVAPSQPVPVVRQEEEERVLRGFTWGFVLHNNDAEKEIINARAESVAEKPTFKKAFRERRCLVLADGFYEWQDTGHGKQPIYFKLKDDSPFAFAGLWTQGRDGEARCLHITTTANKVVAPVHNRMPVMLQPEYEDDWLNAAPMTSTIS